MDDEMRECFKALGERFDGLENRFDGLEKKLDRNHGELVRRFEDQDASLDRIEQGIRHLVNRSGEV